MEKAMKRKFPMNKMIGEAVLIKKIRLIPKTKLNKKPFVMIGELAQNKISEILKTVNSKRAVLFVEIKTTKNLNVPIKGQKNVLIVMRLVIFQMNATKKKK